MAYSLCGKNPCPRICLRVCHCPAGLERSRMLNHQAQARRLVRALHRQSQADARREHLTKKEYPGLDTETGEIKPQPGEGIKEKVLCQVLGKRRPESEKEHTPKYGRASLGVWAGYLGDKPLGRAARVVVLAVLAAVFTLGVIAYNGQPHRQEYSIAERNEQAAYNQDWEAYNGK